MKSRVLAVGLAALTSVSIAFAAGGGGAGKLDKSFSKDGRQTLPTSLATNSFRDVTVDKKGRVVAIADTGAPSDTDYLVARYTAKGKPDSSFSGDGLVDIDGLGLGESDQAFGITVDPQGRIIGVGQSNDGSGFRLAAFRLLPTGALDTAFSGDGFYSVDISGDNNGDRGADVIVDSEGRIVIAGHTTLSGGNADFAVVRLLDNGSPDASFDSNGIQSTSIPGQAVSNDRATSIAIDRQGRIVLAGSRADGPAADDFALVRYLPDNGAEDPAFGTNGAVSLDFDGFGDAAGGVATVKGNKIVAAGSSSDGSGIRFGLARFKVDGSPDGTFGTGGKIALTRPGADGSDGSTLQLDSEGRLVLGGTIYVDNPDPSTYKFGVSRLKPSGKLDKSFGRKGWTSFGFPGSTSLFLTGLTLDPRSQRIVTSGSVSVGANNNLALARIESQPRCFKKVPTLVGTSGNDTLKGTNGPDVIYGGPGNDKLFGKGGKDRLCGGPGKDVTKGGPGKDLEAP